MGNATQRIQVLIPKSLYEEFDEYVDKKKYYSSNSELVREAVRRELEWIKSQEQAQIAASVASLYEEDETVRAFTQLGWEDV